MTKSCRNCGQTFEGGLLTQGCSIDCDVAIDRRLEAADADREQAWDDAHGF